MSPMLIYIFGTIPLYFCLMVYLSRKLFDVTVGDIAATFVASCIPMFREFFVFGLLYELYGGRDVLNIVVFKKTP